jgi:hypothetical protein
MIAIQRFENNMKSRKIAWATGCKCNNDCLTLQLSPPSSVVSDSVELENMKEALRWIAVGVPSVVFAGDVCAEMVQSPQLAGAVRQLAKARRLKRYNSRTSPTSGEWHHCCACSSAAKRSRGWCARSKIINHPAIQRLLERSRSLTKVGIVVRGRRKLALLEQSGKGGHHQAQRSSDNSKLRRRHRTSSSRRSWHSLPPLEWLDITLVNATISSTRMRCSSASALAWATALSPAPVAPISLDRNECFDGASKFGYDDSSPTTKCCRRRASTT